MEGSESGGDGSHFAHKSCYSDDDDDDDDDSKSDSDRNGDDERGSKKV